MTATETERAKRSVEYGVLEVADELPAKPVGQYRPSPLMVTVQSVMDNPAYVGKAVRIAVYDSKTACGAAANVLRQRFGRTAKVRGVEFATRKHTVTDETGEVIDKHGLWLICRPDQIVPGELEKHQAAERARLETLLKRAEAKKAEAAANGEAKADAPRKAPEASAPGNGPRGGKAPTKG